MEENSTEQSESRMKRVARAARHAGQSVMHRLNKMDNNPREADLRFRAAPDDVQIQRMEDQFREPADDHGDAGTQQ